MYSNDNRVVMTLDAGGTNFIFSAIQANKEIVDPIARPSNPNNIGDCLQSIKAGFSAIRSQLQVEPVAISFAFPGPADYAGGVIGDLPNFPAFRGGVALGAYLEQEFNLPVYINNDGNLFAYGEALAGFLPEVNADLKANGVDKQYRNLLGLTIGTGFGAGVVINKQLLLGDNGCGGDVWCFRNKMHAGLIAEESVSIRAVKHFYKLYSDSQNPTLTPYDIYMIADGKQKGNQAAARQSFATLGEVAGDVIAQAATIVDGLVVIGGGVAGAAKYFMPALIDEMNRKFAMRSGDEFPRMQVSICNYDESSERQSFIENKSITVKVAQSNQSVPYQSTKQIAIGISKLGASKAISLGAYAYALSQIDKI